MDMAVKQASSQRDPQTVLAEAGYGRGARGREVNVAGYPYLKSVTQPLGARYKDTPRIPLISESLRPPVHALSELL